MVKKNIKHFLLMALEFLVNGNIFNNNFVCEEI